MDNVSNAGSQLQFILQKQNQNVWWSRLTAQPQKQNWIHVSGGFIVALLSETPNTSNYLHQIDKIAFISFIALDS